MGNKLSKKRPQLEDWRFAGVKEAFQSAKTHVSFIYVKDTEGVERIKRGFSLYPLVTSLELKWCSLKYTEAGQSIGALLKERNNISSLHLDGCLIDGPGARVFGQGLASSTCLRGLRVVGEERSSTSILVDSIFSALTTNRSLVSLSICDLAMSREAAVLLGGVLRTNEHKTLKVLHLSNNNIFEANYDLMTMFEGLASNTHVDDFFFCSNFLGEIGGQHVGNALASNCVLKKITLDCNSLGVEGAKFVAAGLKSNTCVTEVAITSNKLSDAGIIHVCGSLRARAARLITVDFADNDLSNVGAKAISEILASHSGMIGFCVSGNKMMSGTGMKCLADGFKGGGQLSSVNFSGCEIGDDGATYLAEIIGWNPFLRSLNCYSCLIGDDGATRLAKAVSCAKMLVGASFGGNSFGRVGENALFSSLRCCGRLLQLNGIDGIDIVDSVRQLILRNYRASLTAKTAALFIITARKFREAPHRCAFPCLMCFPKELILMIAKMAWEERGR
jgi:Ran GTPase-activating protein (RanGAP) involved in mRNA processing and transport